MAISNASCHLFQVINQLWEKIGSYSFPKLQETDRRVLTLHCLSQWSIFK